MMMKKLVIYSFIKKNLDPNHILYTKINSKWFPNLNISVKLPKK